MANKNKNNNKKQENKKPVATPKAETKPAEKAPKPAPKAPEKPVVETAEVEVVETVQRGPDPIGEAKVVENIIASNSVAGEGLSLDGRVRLLDLASRRFVEAPNAVEKYGEETVKAMDRITAAGIISTFADEAVCGKGSFALILKNNMYPMLATAAKEMGINLPDLKLLAAPANDKEAVVVKASDITISEETKKQVKKEHDLLKEGDGGKIELDPKKVAHMGEEDLKKALEYILIRDMKQHKNIKDSLVGAVDFMQAYRLELAEQAENAGEAKEKIAERSMYAILNDLFQYVTPTIHINGFGKGMHDSIANEGAPITAFEILHRNLTDKETHKTAWDDQSIADATRAIIEFICNNRIKASKEILAELDPKDPNYEAIKKGNETEIAESERILGMLENISFDIITRLDNPDTSEEEIKISNTAMGRVLSMYFPEIDPAERPLWAGLEHNIRQRAGILLNMFCEPGCKNLAYDESNLIELRKMSVEEYEAEQKKKKEAELEAKKAGSKNA
jgi:hypothetical protein